ncbi:hypothetical protein EIL87_23915 [Saccharopolyspora rhizosphaerae]|uniref:Uncharacterized protein n=1 Tax=Saccharopolyspora rhizosphaerae TaxID=2492662 RepID=A0A3R8PV89_9PSEU|nr:hypothetical protein [Saccharopolyspora rhizosphaerae]RRO12744.1 hypothetical protein EIL87_23915 [Saccharopolyspora rhizosphaerae]
MDPRLRADEALARARARGAFVVTPDNATSPMDAANTVRIPREIVDSVVADTDTNMLPTAGQTMQQQPQFPTTDSNLGWPTEDYGQSQQGMPPNPYQSQRAPHEFGPLGSHPGQPQYPQQY